MQDLERAIKKLRGKNRRWIQPQSGSYATACSYVLFEYEDKNHIFLVRDEKWDTENDKDVSDYNVVITHMGIPIGIFSSKDKIEIVAFIAKTLDVAPAF